MKKEKGPPEDAGLRRLAEERLRGGTRETGPSPAEGDARRMLHELQVYQVELELQNEELTQARGELEKQLEKYSDLYNLAPVGYFTLDEAGTILEANLTGSKLLGTERSRLVGSRLVSFLSDDSLRVFDGWLKETCRGTSRENCEVALLQAGGQFRYVQIEGVLVESDRDAVRRCRVAMIDMTRRRRAEEILHRYELLFHSSRDIVLLMRRDGGGILEANAAATNAYGYSRAELLAMTITDLRAVGARGLTADQMARADAGGILFETIHRRKNGSSFPVEVSSQGATIDGTRMLISVVRDITGRKQVEEALSRAHRELLEAKNAVDHIVEERTAELKKAHESLRIETEERLRTEARLRQAHKMEAVGTLAGGIAHDFNNILAAIIGFSELAIDKAPEGSLVRSHMGRVFAAGLRGRELVKQILTFSRQAENERQPLKLAPVIKEALGLLRASLPSTVDIRTNLQGSMGFVLADPVQVQQIVLNLCTNAAHAMKRTGGSISVDLAGFSFSSADKAPDPIMKPGLYARLSVTDTGEGMSPEILDHVFDPFFTTKAAGEGTGLGLSVVHGIVTSHGGAVTVSSRPGEGSTITVYLPKLIDEHSRDPGSGDASIPRGHERILFVDDEEDLAAIGEEMLTELGYRVSSRTGARGALALFRLDPSRFDLVITDQTMPEMTGQELVKEILVLRADTPIIMCTGFSQLIDADSARAVGIRAFAIKPLTKKEIATIIRKVLDE